VQRAACDGPVDQLDEAPVLGLDAGGVPVLCGGREALRQRLDRRALAQVLEPFLGGGADALLLLLDVRHLVEMPAPAGAIRVPE
jgi:hypothetical protein